MPPPFAPGSVSLRLYPHAGPAAECVAELRRQVALAERAGFDGVMVSEHHGGFPGYWPSPLLVSAWALESTRALWAAPCPLLLPLRAWTQVAEELAWLAAAHPGRLGAGLASGGLELDFELADLDFDRRARSFRDALPRICAALRGEAGLPLARDAALAACEADPIPVVAAIQGPKSAAAAARAGAGLLFDSLQPAETLAMLVRAWRDAGGKGSRIAIRRVWLGTPPRAEVDAQTDFYRSYAPRAAQSTWGSDELISAPTGRELAERLAELRERADCDALNLRVHARDIAPERVREQIARLGEEVLPALRASRRAALAP
jgi:alkanesulfonate monooxygenase SsuD/methylene tetrahydromethanopterin reductase-like flavin-dependent oxidoreductase (luciferase family)